MAGQQQRGGRVPAPGGLQSVKILLRGGGWVSPKTVSAAWGVPTPWVARSTLRPAAPPHSPSRTVKWRLNLSLTTLEKICKQEPSLRLVVHCVMWLLFLQPHVNPPTSFKPGFCPGFGTKVNSRFAQCMFLSTMGQDDTLTRQKRHVFSHNHWLHFKSDGTLSPGTFGLGSSEKFRVQMWQLGGRA